MSRWVLCAMNRRGLIVRRHYVSPIEQRRLRSEFRVIKDSLVTLFNCDFETCVCSVFQRNSD